MSPTIVAKAHYLFYKITIWSKLNHSPFWVYLIFAVTTPYHPTFRSITLAYIWVVDGFLCPKILETVSIEIFGQC